MKYYNKENAFIQVGPRESVRPFGTTRDFSEEEVEKIPELRYAVRDRGYLIPWDGKSPLPETMIPATKKAEWVTAPDTQGGETTLKKTSTGSVVEYVMADGEGVDGVENASVADGVVAALDSKKQPAEYIEKGVSARSASGAMKTKWKNASDAFEAELKQETTEDMEFDDTQVLAENEAEREEIPDADTEIIKDQTQILQNSGKMGAQLTTVKKAVQTAAQAATNDLEKALAQNYDDGEPVSPNVSKDTAELLTQPFAAKKWVISKSSDPTFLSEVAEKSMSPGVRDLARQRLEELKPAE